MWRDESYLQATTDVRLDDMSTCTLKMQVKAVYSGLHALSRGC